MKKKTVDIIFLLVPGFVVFLPAIFVSYNFFSFSPTSEWGRQIIVEVFCSPRKYNACISDAFVSLIANYIVFSPFFIIVFGMILPSFLYWKNHITLTPAWLTTMGTLGLFAWNIYFFIYFVLAIIFFSGMVG